MYTKCPRQIISLVRRSDRTTSKRSRDTTEAKSSTYPRAPRKEDFLEVRKGPEKDHPNQIKDTK